MEDKKIGLVGIILSMLIASNAITASVITSSQSGQVITINGIQIRIVQGDIAIEQVTIRTLLSTVRFFISVKNNGAETQTANVSMILYNASSAIIGSGWQVTSSIASGMGRTVVIELTAGYSDLIGGLMDINAVKPRV